MAIMENKTKQKILDVSLDLFSLNGYEATSMSQIAEAVGIKKASLYAHYASKKEIFDTIRFLASKQYEENSIFSKTDFSTLNLINSPSDLAKQVIQQVNYIIHNPYISKFRKLMTIEQFRNQELTDMQSKYSYHNVLDYGCALITHLIKNNILINGDVQAMASEFVFPISMWINLCDREPEMENEAIDLINKHVIQFYKAYKK